MIVLSNNVINMQNEAVFTSIWSLISLLTQIQLESSSVVLLSNSL